MRALWPCRDGWINFVIYGGEAGRHTNRQLGLWMDERGVCPAWLKQIDWSTFAVTQLAQDEVERLEVPIGEFLLGLTKQEFLEGAIQRGMLGYPVATVADIGRDRQLESRGFWQTLHDPNTGLALRYPGGFGVVDGKRLEIPRPAPTLSSFASPAVDHASEG
jgi:crotonobetainyl-CoA:carnitine CoA-transferase CaiB-like acyl-CoA transferase